jgi:hypothetical protein
MRILFGIASFLVLLPGGACLLAAFDVLHVAGSHGLEKWLLLSSCAVMVLLGGILAAVVALRSTALRGPSLALAAVCVLGQFAFLMAYGVPFTR